jgi:hypothetical protein
MKVQVRPGYSRFGQFWPFYAMLGQVVPGEAG